MSFKANYVNPETGLEVEALEWTGDKMGLWAHAVAREIKTRRDCHRLFERHRLDGFTCSFRPLPSQVG